MKKQDIRILVAEDEPTLQHVFKSQLRALGYRNPEFADNGAAAVKMALQKRFDIVFMDIRMPELDGISATQRIREAEGDGPKLPIIGLSAYSQKPSCIAVGMNDYLQKPVLLYQVDEVITRLLKVDSLPAIPPLLADPSRSKVNESKYSASSQELTEAQEKLERLKKQSELD